MVLLVLASCNNQPKPAENNPVQQQASTPTDPAPRALGYDIVHEYPHDATAFTEGLEYKDGFLYESTGQYGASDIRKVQPETGKVLISRKLDSKYFGEGLTILNGKIYQITYREGKGFVYDLKTLSLEKTFIFAAAEGWGMTNNGTSLIYDDGTNTLHFLDPADFKETKRLSVADEKGPVNELNEPEMIHGFIYANQWKTDLILKIDTATGKVVARADLSTLRLHGGIPNFDGTNGSPEVLNGIAYDPIGNRIFVTGKHWPKIFEIKLDN